jgi:RHS repeat-associated protein
VEPLLGIHAYYAFGAELALTPNESSAELMKFTGHERDILPGGPLTLDAMHARYGMGTLGRFLSLDPVLDLKKAMQSPQAWNRYAYVRNNPMRWTDPTGKYTCDGTKDQCKAFEAALNIVRAAANEASRTRQAGATRLNSVVALYGKAGERNGASVVVKAVGVPGATGSALTKGNETTLTVDSAYLNNIVSTGKGYVDLAKTATHEADHALNDRADPSLQTSTSFRDMLFSERSAWRTENYINSFLGIPDSAASIWMPGVGWNPAALESTARANAAADCSLIPGGCTP